MATDIWRMEKHQGVWNGIEYESAGDLAVKSVENVDTAANLDRDVITDILTHSNPAESRVVKLDTEDESGDIKIHDFAEEFEHASVFCLIRAVRGPRDATQHHGYRLTGVDTIEFITSLLESGEFSTMDSGVLTDRAQQRLK